MAKSDSDGENEDRNEDETGEVEDRDPEEQDEEQGENLDSDDSEEEDNNPELDQYEKDGFLVDDVEEGEEEEEADEEGSEDGKDDEDTAVKEGEPGTEKKKKKKKRKHDMELADGDIDLIAEATGRAPRKRDESDGESSNKHRLKRLKRKTDISKPRESDMKESLQHELFGDDEEDAEQDEPEQPVEQDAAEEIYDEDDEMDGFIVDDERGDGSAPGQNSRKRPANRATYRNWSAVREVFGNSFDDMMRPSAAPDENAPGADMEPDGLSVPLSKDAQNITDIYEPADVDELFLTEKDDQIRHLDYPERFQLRNMHTRPAPVDGELNAEADWICRKGLEPMWEQGSNNRPPKAEVVIPKIASLLDFIRTKFWEVPFIAAYRKEYYQPELSKDDLWTIYDWDHKWGHLLSRKDGLKQLFQKAIDAHQESLDKETADNRDATLAEIDDIKRLLTLIDDCDTEEEMNDLYTHFSVLYGAIVHAPAAGSSSLKRPLKRDKYALCKSARLGDFAVQFALSGRQLGEHLRTGYKEREPNDPVRTPDDMATQYVCPSFPKPENVLEGVKAMLAIEIAVDAQVRKYVREYYWSSSVLTTAPTPKGKRDIDSKLHPYAALKYLHRKPVAEFRRREFETQFLLILKAEHDGFLTCTITLPDQKKTDLLKEMENLYKSNKYSENASMWNHHRNALLAAALNNHLDTLLIKEVRTKLTNDAKAATAARITRKMQNMINLGPYTPPHKDMATEGQDDDDQQGPASHKTWKEPVRVMACCRGPAPITKRNTACERTVCVMLDGDGEMVDHVFLNYMYWRKDSTNERQKQCKLNDIASLNTFIRTHRPHVVVVGTNGLMDRQLFNDLRDSCEEISSSDPDALPDGLTRVRVTYCDAEAARIYQHSKAATAEFKDDDPLLRQAVAVGRRLADPLAALAALCNQHDEALLLNLDPLQKLLSKDEHRAAIERAFINVTNDVGADINRMSAHPWLAAPLQFIAGLGPRKAAFILQGIQAHEGRVGIRRELRLWKLVGTRVEKNCIGFIRIRAEKGTAYNREHHDVLDDTRVHRESYDFAIKIATGAFQKDDEDEEDKRSSHPEQLLALPEKQRRDMLDELDLELYAEQLEQNNKGKKFITVNDIKDELIEPFKERRRPYADPTEDELFNLLTGETDDTLHKGVLVTATVVKYVEKANGGGFVRCRLESGVDAQIPWQLISSRDDFDPSHIKEGMTVTGKVMRVTKQRFQVDLSTRADDLSRHEDWPDNVNSDRWRRWDDPTTTTRPQPEQNVKKYVKRVIAHPLFFNMSRGQAEASLADKPIGDLVFRPSSKGHDHLACTWKLFDNVYRHVDIVEKDKSSAMSLGTTLVIANERFEDLDELYTRYMTPIVEHVKALVKHRKFDSKPAKEIHARLVAEKQQNAQVIPYAIGLPTDEASTSFSLYYLPNQRIRTERINVTPKGLKYREFRTTSPDKLLIYFKQHCQEPLPSALHHAHQQQRNGSQSSSWGAQHGPPARPAHGALPYPPHSRGGAPMPHTPSWGAPRAPYPSALPSHAPHHGSTWHADSPSRQHYHHTPSAAQPWLAR